MEEKIGTDNYRDCTQNQYCSTENPKTTKPPYYHRNTKTYQEEAGRFGHRIFLRPIAAFVRQADIHNGIITGVATAVLAYLTYSLASDSAEQAKVARGQLTAINGQLAEMKEQRLITIEQLRAKLRFEHPDVHPVGVGDKYITAVGEQIIGWDINPVWTNVGQTDAIAYTSFWNLDVVNIPKDGTKLDCPKSKAPGAITPTIISKDGKVTEIAQRLSIQDATDSMGKDQSKVIFMVGESSYRDVFTSTVHSKFWCVVVGPHDLARNEFSFFRAEEKAK